jgi:phage-related protein
LSIIRGGAPKPVDWIGRAHQELRDFPRAARNQAGVELRAVQNGLTPADWKPLENVGPGAAEIRVRSFQGGTVQHRVIYVAKFPEAVYVLHAFEKKTQTTPQHHLQIAAKRYREMVRMRALRKENA